MKELVVYVRRTYCPDVQRTRDFLAQHAVPHRLIDADDDSTARERVLAWTGHLSFPTLVIVDGDSTEPRESPLPLKPGQSPRDVDRGTILTEGSTPVLEEFLRRHGLLT